MAAVRDARREVRCPEANTLQSSGSSSITEPRGQKSGRKRMIAAGPGFTTVKLSSPFHPVFYMAAIMQASEHLRITIRRYGQYVDQTTNLLFIPNWICVSGATTQIHKHAAAIFLLQPDRSFYNFSVSTTVMKCIELVDQWISRL